MRSTGRRTAKPAAAREILSLFARQHPLVTLAGVILSVTAGVAAGADPGITWTAINSGITSASFGITRLIVDPGTPSTLYAVTNLGGLFKSADSAGTWKPIHGVASVNFLSIDPQNSSTLYVASGQGIFKSTDGGSSWNGSSSGLTGASMVVVDPVTPSTLYGVINGGLFKSTNGGESWGAIKNFPALNGIDSLGFLAIDPVTPSTVYAVNHSGAILKSTDGAESWSSIRAAQGAAFGDVLQLAIDPQTPSTLYAGGFAAFRGLVPPGPFDDGTGATAKSTDGGQTWTTLRVGIPGGVFVSSPSIDPAAPSTIFASYSGNGSGIIRSLDGGQRWNVVNSVSQGLPTSLVAVGRGSPSEVYASYSNYAPGAGSILKSTDSGASWSAANAGLEFFDLRVLRFDPIHSGVVYTGGAGGIYKSSDSGSTWTGLSTFQVLPHPNPVGGGNPFDVGSGIVRSLLIDSADPNNLYVDVARVNGCDFTDRVVFKSVDGGASWSDSVSPDGSGCLVSGGLGGSGGVMAIDPIDPKVLYLQETDDEDGIYMLLKSTDGGASWNAIWAWPNESLGVNVVVVDPTNPATIYAAGAGLFKSTDSGATWNETGLTSYVTVLAMDPNQPSVLYAASGGVLFKSADGGASWAAINTSIDTGIITALLIAPNQSNTLYAATSGDGVYESLDGGANWVRFNDGLNSLDVRALAFPPSSPNTLYAATASGIFKAAVNERRPNQNGRRH